MAYRKKTLRKMSPTARKVARLAGEIDSISRRLKNLIVELQQLDVDSKALKTAKANYSAHPALIGTESISWPNCWIHYPGNLEHGDSCPHCKEVIP